MASQTQPKNILNLRTSEEGTFTGVYEGTNPKKNAIRESSLRKEAHTLKDPIRVPKHKSTNTQGVVYTLKHEVQRQGRFTW